MHETGPLLFGAAASNVRHVLAMSLGVAMIASCSANTASSSGAAVGVDAIDVPLALATKEQVRRFERGDALFELTFRAADGLGPLYIRASCGACHERALRGPGLVQKMVVTEHDGVTPAADQSKLPFGHTVRPFVSATATTAIFAPDDPSVKITIRVGPPVLGRGYLEAVQDGEIERVAAEQAEAGGSIRGRINRVTFTSMPNLSSPFGTHATGESGLIGRFGLKARIVSLDDFTADALQGDMGVTSPMRPDELANPDGETDDLKTGIDTTADLVNDVADYMRLIEIPRRPAGGARGAELFAAALCATCHVPSLRTRADYPIRQLAGIDAPIFSDLLLHDMGPALADGLTDGSAGPRDWRTAPLIGLRFLRSYLHDGRAPSIEAAVVAHADDGSEAEESARRFAALGEDDRRALLDYVAGL